MWGSVQTGLVFQSLTMLLPLLLLLAPLAVLAQDDGDDIVLEGAANGGVISNGTITNADDRILVTASIPSVPFPLNEEPPKGFGIQASLKPRGELFTRSDSLLGLVDCALTTSALDWNTLQPKIECNRTPRVHIRMTSVKPKEGAQEPDTVLLTKHVMWALQEILYFWGKTFSEAMYAEMLFQVKVGDTTLGYGLVQKTLEAEADGDGQGVETIPPANNETGMAIGGIAPFDPNFQLIEVSPTESEVVVPIAGAGVGVGSDSLTLKVSWVLNGKILCNEFRFHMLMLETLTEMAELASDAPYPGDSWYVKSADVTFELLARNSGVLEDGEFNQVRAARAVEVLAQVMLGAKKERQYREFSAVISFGKRKVGLTTMVKGPQTEVVQPVGTERRARRWNG